MRLIKNLVLSLLLASLALVLFVILAPIGLLWGLAALCFRAKFKAALEKIAHYFMQIAISIDQAGNVFCAAFFNDALIRPLGPRFGHPDETISSVLGKNKKAGTLTIIGKALSLLLDTLDPNHVTKSIEP